MRKTLIILSTFFIYFNLNAEITGDRPGFWKEQGFFDITGNRIFDGYYGYDLGVTIRHDREADVFTNIWSQVFFEEYGSQLNFYEWINNKEYNLTLGRTETVFTPLTLQKTLFRWGYDRSSFDKSLGGAYDPWRDQRGARIMVKDKKNSFTALIHKTAYPGNDDDRFKDWEEGKARQGKDDNVDEHRYFIGMRYTTRILGLNLGLSFINEHFTKLINENDNDSSKGWFNGDIEDSPPQAIVLKFTDDSPYNDNYPEITDDTVNDGHGAAIYSIYVKINGVINNNFTVLNGKPAGNYVSLNNIEGIKEPVNERYKSYSDRIEVSGPANSGNEQQAHYVFNFKDYAPDYTEFRNIEFIITAANDYRIEIAPLVFNTSKNVFYAGDDNFKVLARAPGNVKDYSNKTTITYSYGKETGKSILGLDLSGEIPYITANFNLDLACLRKYRKYPAENGSRTTENATAVTFELQKNIRNILLVGRYFNIDPEYDASFSVEDNDDRDNYPDIIDYDGMTFRDVDKNANDIPDYDEDFLLFDIDKGFRNYFDFNNNDIFDFEENDASPDYGFVSNSQKFKVYSGQKGFTLQYNYRVLPYIKLMGGYFNINEELTGAEEKMFHHYERIENKNTFGDWFIDHELKKVKDNIRNNTVDYYQDVEEYTDKLKYRDTLSNILRLGHNFIIMEKIALSAYYRYDNYKYYYNSSNAANNTGIIKARYNNWFPFTFSRQLKKWQVLPLLKIERVNKVTITSEDIRNIESDYVKYISAVEFINQITERTRLFAGIQLIKYNDLLYRPGQDDNSTGDDDIASSYFRKVYAFEVISNNSIGDRPFVIKCGIKSIDQDSDYYFNKIKNLEMYLQAFFRW